MRGLRGGGSVHGLFSWCRALDVGGAFPGAEFVGIAAVFVGSDDVVADGEGGEVGVHPEFGRGGGDGSETMPELPDARFFLDQADIWPLKGI